MISQEIYRDWKTLAHLNIYLSKVGPDRTLVPETTCQMDKYELVHFSIIKVITGLGKTDKQYFKPYDKQNYVAEPLVRWTAVN